MYTKLPKTTLAKILGKQLLRSGTSVGAHYHEGIRSRSDAEYISKLEGSLQELQETVYWLELIVEAKIVRAELMKDLLAEAQELVAILVACVRKTKSNSPKKWS